MAATLYLVATPIGNLEDITLRALRILREEVQTIACEDTRQTQKLLSHFQIRKPLISYHDHNEAAQTEQIISALTRGDSVALVSDAGTPLISDPGYRVVVAAIAANFPVVPIPGASRSFVRTFRFWASDRRISLYRILAPEGVRSTESDPILCSGTRHGRRLRKSSSHPRIVNRFFRDLRDTTDGLSSRAHESS